MQYKIGTVSVVNGSHVVTGYLTSFLANVKVGDSFKVYDENTIYQVIAVDSDTQIQIGAAAYAGSTQSGVRYQICRDRTPNLGLAEINAGDEDWPYWLTNEVLRVLDTKVSGGTVVGGGGASLFSALADVYVGPTAPTDPTKIFWVKTPTYTGQTAGTVTVVGATANLALSANAPPVAIWSSTPSSGTLRTDGHWSVTGLVGAWPFNEGTGTTAANLVGGGSAAALNGDASLTANGLHLGGVNGYATAANYAGIGHATDDAAPFTVIVKLKNNATISGARIFDKNRWYMSYYSNAKLYASRTGSVSTSCYSVETPLQPGAWVTAGFRFNNNSSGVIDLFANGVECTYGLARTPISVPTADTTYGLTFGALSNGSNNYFNGDIACVLYYNRALTDSEIQSLSANIWQIFG